MKKSEKVILWSGGTIIVIFLIIQKILQSMNLNFRGNYYNLFNFVLVFPILLFLFWFVPKLLKSYKGKKTVFNVIQLLGIIIIVVFSGFIIHELMTLDEDIVVVDGVEYVANVRSQNLKYKIDGLYYEVINDYFVKEPFSFEKKIEEKWIYI